MPSMYAKLMARITESSLMEEDIPVRYCFMMMLAMADPQGYVVGTDVAIARRMNMDLKEFQRCTAALQEPDPDSNSMEHEGRRIIVSDVERGYYVINYRKYRDTRDEEERREYMRLYMQKRRGGKQEVAPVKKCKPRKLLLAHAEGDGKEDAVGGAASGKKPVTHEEWLAGLKANPAYTGIDIDTEINKAREWVKAKPGRQFTRPFVVNWLNRIEKPIPPTNGHAIPDSDPPEWRQWCADQQPPVPYKTFRFADDFHKTDFFKWRKAQRT